MLDKGCDWKYTEVKTQSLVEKTQIHHNFGWEICKQFLYRNYSNLVRTVKIIIFEAAHHN